MNPSTTLIVNDLPEPGSWDFGGFAYGLEPLTLSEPGGKDSLGTDDLDTEVPHFLEQGCLRLLAIDPNGGTLDVDTLPPKEELFWFRWITGHQVSFIIWTLMARAIRRATADQDARSEVLRELTHYIRGYCGMLLYTGSCPPSVYETVIRPSMYRQHRGFSGGWAPDYHPVRDLFRGRRLPWIQGPEAAALIRATRLHQHIHSGVAARLVPDGPSLLRRSGAESYAQDRRLLGLIYDNYFMTLRAPVRFCDVVAQLLRRLHAIAMDLGANGLYPITVDADTEAVEELLGEEVLALEHELPVINFRVAGFAAGLTDRFMSERLAAASDMTAVPARLTRR